MEKYVIDTSVIVKWFTDEIGRERALEYLTKIQSLNFEVFLPEVTKYELGNALLKGKKMPLDKAKKVLTVFYSLPVKFIANSRETAMPHFD